MTAILVALLLIAGMTSPGAHADELVQVALHRAAVPPDKAGPPLFGYLARPRGPGPFPALVLLHGCYGFGTHDVSAALRLKTWGYVALALDSLGDENRCRNPGGAFAEAEDAYAGLRYLTKQRFVQSHRIGVLGFSMGGVAVLDAVERGVLGRSGTLRFAAAIAYYPACRGSTGVMDAPTLILIGEKDDWASADACRDMVARRSIIGMNRTAEPGAPVALVVYPQATHAFDSPGPPHTYLGHVMRYDSAATRSAQGTLQAFLHNHLELSAAEPTAPPAPEPAAASTAKPTGSAAPEGDH